MSSLEDFQKLLKSTDKPIFVMWSATWCAPCRLIKPIFTKESKENTNDIFVIVDIDQGQDISVEYKISKIPIIKVFVKGVEKDEMSGSNGDTLKKFLSKHKTVTPL